MYRTDGAAQGDWEQQETGMCVVDERTLIVVRGNCQVTLFDSTSAPREREHVHSLRFANYRRDLAGFRAVVVSLSVVGGSPPNRLFVSVEGDEIVYEIEWTREWADWRVAMAHTLPDRWLVKYLHFDDRSRRFALAVECSDGNATKSRVSVLNERLVEVVRVGRRDRVAT